MADEQDRRYDLVSPDLQPKMLHAGDQWQGQPFVFLSDGQVVLAGSLEHGISVDPEFGTHIQGPISLSDTPENISVAGGYWRINPMVLACIGSSAAMPVPWLVPSDPELLAGASDIAGILGGL
jgi:hypothetical protein